MNFGEFTESVNRIEDNLNEVRSVWADQTSCTYDRINENIEEFTMKIWQSFNIINGGQKAVEANYDESEFNNELNRLNSKIYSV